MSNWKMVMKPLVFNGIAIYRNAIKNSKDIIEATEYSSGDMWNPATVVHADGSKSTSDVRTNEFLFLPQVNEIYENETDARTLISFEFHKAFKPCIADFCAKFTIDVDVNIPTAYQILRYGESEYYIPHLDDGKNTRRRVSAVGYLNDDYEGGELWFPNLNFNYYPTAGDIVVFPSGAPFTHEAKPVKQGVKYSVVNWWE